MDFSLKRSFVLIFFKIVCRSLSCKVCSLWSCAFLAFCSSEHTYARESTFFTSPGKSSFRAINSLSSKAQFPANVFQEIKWTTAA